MGALLSLLALTASATAALLAVRAHWHARLATARAQADAVRGAGRRAAEAHLASARGELERQRAALAADAERGLALAREELAAHDAEVTEREESLGRREAAADTRAAELDSRARALSELKARRRALDAEWDELRVAHVTRLEERCGLTPADAVEQLARAAVERVDLALQRQRREHEEELDKQGAQRGRHVIATVTSRYDGVGHLERIQNTIEIPDARTLLALVDPQGAAQRAFADEIGCGLECDEEQATATVRGDDPLAREVARRALRQIANACVTSPDKIRRLASNVREEVDREVQNAGRKAARLLDVHRVHPDILHLVGRLKYRLSYSQNQWKHAVEVGYLAGLIAAELRLDVAAARRGGLMHDIGKAVTHEREGAHAVLGGEVARRCGEDELIANAIAAHHHDEPPQSAIALVVAAADAISGARPGARRESATQFVTRMHEIQTIAMRSPAVLRADVMHAGREVRIVVAGREQGEVPPEELRHGERVLRDEELQPLARDIARALEEEVAFAGQIRVTVIRESRAVAIAR